RTASMSRWHKSLTQHGGYLQPRSGGQISAITGARPGGWPGPGKLPSGNPGGTCMANRPVNAGSGAAAAPPPVPHDATPATPAGHDAATAAPAGHRAARNARAARTARPTRAARTTRAARDPRPSKLAWLPYLIV